MTGDVDPELARRTRERVTAELESSGLHAVTSHFPGMRFGRLIEARGRRQWLVDGVGI